MEMHMADSLVTIEGSLSPSSYLPRGERRKVVRTRFIDKLILKGFVVVIEDHGPQAEAVLSPSQTDAVTDVVNVPADDAEAGTPDERTATEREADEQASAGRAAKKTVKRAPRKRVTGAVTPTVLEPTDG